MRSEPFPGADCGEWRGALGLLLAQSPGGGPTDWREGGAPRWEPAKDGAGFMGVAEGCAQRRRSESIARSISRRRVDYYGNARAITLRRRAIFAERSLRADGTTRRGRKRRAWEETESGRNSFQLLGRNAMSRQGGTAKVSSHAPALILRSPDSVTAAAQGEKEGCKGSRLRR